MPAAKKIDWKLFEKLVTECPRAVLTDLHIADMVGVTIKTLTKGCREHYGKSISLVRLEKENSIRRTLFERLCIMSAKGNFGATVWLTKNLMNWSDKSEVKTDEKAKVVNKTTVFNVEFGDGTPNDT
jgi:hypothetical protein